MRLGHMNNPKRKDFIKEVTHVRKYIYNGIAIQKCENEGAYKIKNNSPLDIYVQVKQYKVFSYNRLKKLLLTEF